ncbi:MAG: hypothetical protein ACPG49_00870 [Chitinophagales bacterium]
MKKLLITLLVFISISPFVVANSGFDDYTYRKDRPFHDIRQLQGQTFVPQEYSDGTLGKTQVKAGDIKVHVGNNMVHIDGIPELGSFSIVAAASTRVGYEFKLMDSRGYSPSKMKVVLDQNNFVELVYLYSRKHGEFTFFLPSKTKKDLAKERAYFSNKKTVLIEGQDDLSDLELVPYQQTVNVNNPLALKEKISIKKGLSFKIGTNYVIFKSGKTTKHHKLSKSKITLASLKNHPNVIEIWELKTTGRRNNVKLFLNKGNEIEFFDIDDIRYTLL